MKKKYLFWITGLPGSGKTTIAKNIKKDIEKAYGPTIEISGDNLRKIFKFKSFKMKEREKYAKNYSAFCKFLINKGYNVIFSTVSLHNIVHKLNRKQIKNYYEIYVKTDIKKLIKLNKKKIYKKKKDVIGLDLKVDFPKKPNLVVKNELKKNIKKISKEVLKNILKDCKI